MSVTTPLRCFLCPPDDIQGDARSCQDPVKIEPLKARTEECHGDTTTYVETMQVFRFRHYQLVLQGWFANVQAALLKNGELRGLDVKASKNKTLLRCVVFAQVCEVSKVRSSGGVSK